MPIQVDFTSQEYFRDPAGALSQLRKIGPVLKVKFPIIGWVWITTTSETTSHVLKDADIFRLRREDGSVAGVRWWMPRVIRSIANNMLTMDEPDHSRLRSMVDEVFRRRAVMDMEPSIYAIANKLAAELFAGSASADLVSRYARRIPLFVICELLGLPDVDRPKFIDWTDSFTRVNNLFGFLRALPVLVRLRRYLEHQIEDARVRGGEGLIAELVQIESEGGRLSRDEIVAMVFLLLVAGTETTSHLISGSVFELLRDPRLRDWLEADWNRVNLSIEEFLRFLSPVQFSKPRYVRKDNELGGVQLKRGDKILAMLAAANMDPAVHERSEKLDLERRPNRHVAFGTGLHFCLGHQLARLEAKCALKALFDRWPDLGLAIEEDKIRWRRRPGLKAIEALPLRPKGRVRFNESS